MPTWAWTFLGVAIGAPVTAIVIVFLVMRFFGDFMWGG